MRTRPLARASARSSTPENTRVIDSESVVTTMSGSNPGWVMHTAGSPRSKTIHSVVRLASW